MHRVTLLRHPLPWILLALGLLFGSVGCSTFDDYQRRLIFSPSKDPWWGAAAPQDSSQEVWLEFDSQASGRPARLHGVWLPSADPRAPALLYLHGARWDLSGSMRRMERMRDLGFSVFGVDYRGFGKSGDELPSERMAYEDALAGWRWLAEHAADRPRFIFGHSLGSAIGVQLASQIDDASGLILEGSFTSIADVVSTLRWGWLPVGGLITQRFDAADRIAQVGVPVLVVHGSEDRLIRPELGQKLYEAAAPPKRFVLVEGGSHHNTNSVGQAQYREALHELFGLGATGPLAAGGNAAPAPAQAAVRADTRAGSVTP